MAGMMGGPVAADASPIGIDRAATAARDYIARFGDENLELAEVMEFSANYYAQAVESDTGAHAFEMLVDKYTGAVFPEMDPDLVWNTKYGTMGGMMDGWRLDVGEPDLFYGYYTLDTLRDQEVEGMLSVNGFTGEVWYHVWHGPFVQERTWGTGTGAVDQSTIR